MCSFSICFLQVFTSIRFDNLRGAATIIHIAIKAGTYPVLMGHGTLSVRP